MRSPREFEIFKRLYALLALFVVSWSALSAAERPNILFIAVDDLRPELGTYGSPIAKSPNIDRLAQQGLRFDRAYCQEAICRPSRASLMTGLRPDRTGVVENFTYFRDIRPEVVTLPRHFMNHGYEAIGIGKIFHGPTEDAEHSWDRVLGSGDHGLEFERAPGGYQLKENQEIYSRNRDAMLAKYGEKARRYGVIHGPAYESADVPDNAYREGFYAELAMAELASLAERPQQPWFLAVGFHVPHLNFLAPKRYWDLYDKEKIHEAVLQSPPLNHAEVGLHPSFELRVRHGIPESGRIEGELARTLRHGYYACVSYVDAQVGKIVDRMERLGLAGNTIIVIWSDHGWHLGEMGIWGKATNYEIATRVPLIVVDPRLAKFEQGRATDGLVELVDLYPTLCDMAGIPIPEGLDGRSFQPLLKDPDLSWEETALSQFPSPALREWAANPLSPGMRETFFGPLVAEKEAQIKAQHGDDWDRELFEKHLMGYSMRADRYRIVLWKDRRDADREPLIVELYDHAEDPSETVNIAERRPEVVKRLSRLFRDTYEAK